jgi:HAD superfamily hydrolase (TIGR01549 family)
MALGAILDVDGTLVDTNYHHAIAWYRALREHGETVSTYRIHRHMGMGGDHLVAAVVGDDFEEEHGKDVRATEKECYAELIDEVAVLPGARELVVQLKELGHVVVLASSAKEEELDHYIDLLDARELADAWTMSADVEATKPDPDLVNAALEKAGDVERSVMVGDSTWDCEAAKRADVPTLAVLTGGFAPEELKEAGAKAVFESPEELLGRLDETPLGASVTA